MFGCTILLMCIIKSGLGQFRPASHCEIQRQGPSPEWAKPKCNPDGSYKIYQCDAYTRTTCWCVYENGQMIPGTVRKVHDPEQEKRDLAKCEKARKSAPPAPPPAPAPSAALDQRLGYHLATDTIPDPNAQQVPNMAAGSTPPQEVTVYVPTQDCPQLCSSNCPPGCPIRLSQQIAIPPMQPQMMPMPQPMQMPQMMPCPLPCQGATCPPGCPQVSPAIPQQMPVQMPAQMAPQMPMPMPTQGYSRPCPPMCMNTCPPGCPSIVQQQQQQQQQAPIFYQQPAPQPAPVMPVQMQAMPQPQACPNPCVTQCPPGCPQTFMDPSTGQMQQGLPYMMQQSYPPQNQFQQYPLSLPRAQKFAKTSQLKSRSSKYKSNLPNKSFMKIPRGKGRFSQVMPKRTQNMLIRRAQRNQRNFWKNW